MKNTLRKPKEKSARRRVAQKHLTPSEPAPSRTLGAVLLRLMSAGSEPGIAEREKNPRTIWRITLNLLGVALGFGFSLLCGFSRLPKLYDGLWVDEVHYNYAFVSARSFDSLRNNADWLMRPLLDFVLRKWVWFSSVGLALTERNLALVSWGWGVIHVITLVCVPWTPYWTLRFVVGVLLGFCSLESAYSTEAQGYSFASLGSTLLCLGLWATTRCLKRRAHLLGLTPFLIGFAISLNSHFFSWPIAFLLAGALCAYVATDGQLRLQRRQLLGGIILICGAILFVTIVINGPALTYLMYTPPMTTARISWNWITPLVAVSAAWYWVNVPGWLYLIIVACGLVHPVRESRYLAWGLAGAILVVKFFLVALITATSNYPLSDRYFIMFIPPGILAFGLGLECIAENAERLRKGLRTGILAVALILLLGLLSPGWKEVLGLAKKGLSLARTAPANYSRAFQFFEKANSFQRPLLVLTNTCFSTDFPKFYLQFLVSPPRLAPVVLNMARNCETNDTDREIAITEFLADHREDGLVVFYYEIDHGLNPCEIIKGRPILYQQRDYTCLAVVEARQFTIKELQGF